MNVITPGVGAAGSVNMLMTLMGPQDLAQIAGLTSNTAALADKFDAVNDNPATAPLIGNGDQYIVMQGNCVDGVGGAGDDCDDFFTLTNALARPDTITVNAAWFTGADVDILFCNAACTAFVGSFGGATAANPENVSVVIPAATTWRLWLNLFAPNPNTVVRVRVSGQG
jgi:hypothetical protein